MKGMSISVAAAVVMTLAITVSGCGTTSGEAGEGATKAKGVANAADNAGRPVDGGSITIGQGTKYNDQFLPAVDASLYTANIVGMAFDSLLRVDNKLNFIPDLAKSWEWSDDKKTLTIHLDPKANWSDGKPITSDDVLFTIDVIGGKDYATALQGQYGYLVANILGADKVLNGQAKSFADTGGFKRIDDKTFSLTFKSVDAAVLYSDIANIQPMPQHVLKDKPVKTWSTLDENKKPTVVSGPYQFTKVNGQDSVEMDANPNYFLGRPHIQRIVFKTVSPNVAPGLLANGTLDLMLNGLKPSDVSGLKTLNNIIVKTMAQNGYFYLGLKLYNKEFQDVRVRQAFEYALNRQGMVDGILKGYGSVISGPLPAVSWAAATEKDGLNPYPYDKEKANQLLDEAGWKKGPDGLRIDPVTGKTANLHLAYYSGDPVVQATCMDIEQDLAAVGVKVTLDTPLDFNTLANKVESDDKSLQMWYMGWALGIDPDPRGLWESTASFNFPRWVDKHDDDLIAQTVSAQAFDKNFRRQALIQWQLYVNQKLPYVFLYAPDNIWAVSKRLHIPGDDWNVTGPINVQDWWVES
ncbi:ABC transporter substrate-binding protein [Alicyclobacillus sp.]|uniref:ABC transporter substrate-binding protein n=1 Tax=Alicyclobacillus sp. TaxID=61169 RepID=UPI0025BA722F|nr:ABC transporter substrate-binding protein [Alicyclobacillus sp.]MCL6516694.1 hypothetical protein [Alicyclobacillus sp.]